MSKIKDAKAILKALGLPTKQQNEISALTLLALCSVKPSGQWAHAERKSLTISKDIMAFVRESYHRNYAPNTRETFRREVLHQLEQARVVDRNPDEPNLPTNSPRAHYAISQAAFAAVRAYGTEGWAAAVNGFRKKEPALASVYRQERAATMVPARLSDGRLFRLSPGKHNRLQAAIVEEFAPRFAPGSQVLYFGDTANKNLLMGEKTLAKLGAAISDHDKLADVVLLDAKRNWLFLIEAVTSHGPMSPKRVFELKSAFRQCPVGLVFVSAFPDFAEFRKNVNDIAWETEVWIADFPDHLIHYNGDKFLGPR
jgi:type II restriction enzyme